MAAKPVTLGEAVEKFLATLSPATADSYGKALKPLAEEFGAGTLLTGLDADDVADSFEERWGRTAPATWNARRAAIRAAAAYWQEHRWGGGQIAGRVRTRKPRTELPAEPLTTAELEALIAACSADSVTGIRSRAMIYLLSRSGLRVSELLALRVNDVDFGHHSLRLRTSKSGRAQTRGFHPSADEALRRWIDRRAGLGIPSNGHPLFCVIWDGMATARKEAGEALSPYYVRNMLREAGQRAGVAKRVHPHGLRHTFAAQLIHSGADIVTVQHLLGHESAAATARYIDHLTNDSAVRALERLDLPPLAGEKPPPAVAQARAAKAAGLVAVTQQGTLITALVMGQPALTAKPADLAASRDFRQYIDRDGKADTEGIAAVLTSRLAVILGRALHAAADVGSYWSAEGKRPARRPEEGEP